MNITDQLPFSLLNMKKEDTGNTASINRNTPSVVTLLSIAPSLGDAGPLSKAEKSS